MLRGLLSTILVMAAPLAASAGSPATPGATTFTVTIENVSKPTTLRSKNGETAPAPNSPGVWVIHRQPAPLFKVGETDLGWGLEAQAEDGNPAALAEHCMHHAAVISSGVFSTPVGDEKPGPALPGKRYQFQVSAVPGTRLSFTTMFGQSNDLFYAPGEAGIALFDRKGRAISGDVTSQLVLWDAGTEVNQEPGFGSDQGPRQAAPNTGAQERKPVAKVKDGFKYPKASHVLRVTITPSEAVAQH